MMTIIDGKLSLGGLGTQFYKEKSRESEIATSIALTIQASNNEAVLGGETLTNFIMQREEVIPRINGQPIPLEIGNVFFTEGGLNSEARGFDVYYKNFTMKKGALLDVKAFSHDSKEIFDARNKGLDLFSKDARDVDKIAKAYVNRYNPYVRLLPLITGSSLTTKVVTKDDNGSEDITRAFGWVRGENVEDFIPSIYGVTTANHYRARKGSVLDKKDITNIVDLLEAYDSYSGEGVIAIAHPRTIEDMASLFKAPTNQDNLYIDGIYAPNFLGMNWLPISQMHKDFIIFLDKGRKDLILRCVNKDEQQRGFKLLQENVNEGFTLDSGANGVKAVIFEEEYIAGSRFAGAILDIGAQESTGEMGTTSITKLEKFAESVEAMYKR